MENKYCRIRTKGETTLISVTAGSRYSEPINDTVLKAVLKKSVKEK